MKWFYILLAVIIIYWFFFRNTKEHFWGENMDTWNLVPRQFDDYEEMHLQFDESRDLTFIPQTSEICSGIGKNTVQGVAYGQYMNVPDLAKLGVYVPSKKTIS